RCRSRGRRGGAGAGRGRLCLRANTHGSPAFHGVLPLFARSPVCGSVCCGSPARIRAESVFFCQVFFDPSVHLLCFWIKRGKTPLFLPRAPFRKLSRENV